MSTKCLETKEVYVFKCFLMYRLLDYIQIEYFYKYIKLIYFLKCFFYFRLMLKCDKIAHAVLCFLSLFLLFISNILRG